MHRHLIKPLLALIFLSVLTSCEIRLLDDIESQYGIDTFSPAIERSEKNDENINIIVFTDAHLGSPSDREEEGITEFKEMLGKEKQNLDLVVSLGDLNDDGSADNSHFLDFISFIENEDIPFLPVLGNHEMQSGNHYDYWKDFSSSHKLFPPVCNIIIGGELSIYALDSSLRIYTTAQLKALEKAVSNDSTPYKIFFTHTDTTSGEGLNQSIVFLLGHAEIAEPHRLYRIMGQNGVRFLMNGHRHHGGGLIRHTHFTELSADSLLPQDDDMIESKTMWYHLSLDTTTGLLTVRGYGTYDGEKKTEYVIDLSD